MYVIIEMQKNANGTLGNIVQTAETLNQAKSICHTILAAAAVSSVPVHTAVVLTEDGIPVMSESFRHEEALENE